MKSIIRIPLVMLFCLFVGQIQAAETPPIVETFACQLANGKGAQDVESASSYWSEQVDKIDNEALNQYAAWVITPIRSNLPADFFWLGASPNMNTWAQGNAAYAESSEGAAADKRFAEMSSCTSSVWSSEQLYSAAQPDEGDTSSILEVYGCSLHKGKTMSNVMAVEANFMKAAKETGLSMNIFRFSPIYTDGNVDLLYLIGHDDMASYGATITTQFTTPATATANRYFGLVMDCGAGLYAAENIRAPQAAE